MAQETDITGLLERARTIAVVGCSPKPDRDSHRVAAYLQAAGYRVIPINPGADEILGVTAYPDLASIPGDIEIDIVDVFRRPEHIPAVVDAVLARGAKALWLQLGCANPDAEKRASDAGLEVVSDRCIKVEHRNRFSG
ncbi:MAG: CoA-binding protein [Candidatus Sulfomarinibacteraceae bacterium]